MLRNNVSRLTASALLAAGVLGATAPAQAGQGSCAQPISSGNGPVASDCLYILRTAVGSVTPTKACITQPRGIAPAKASDALVCLGASVGQDVALDCPCGTPDVESTDYTFDPATDIADPILKTKFVKTTYLGAFSQDQDPSIGDWTKDWTVRIHGNNKVWHPASEGTLNGATPSANGACPAGTTLNGTKTMPAPFTGTMDVCDLPNRFATDGGTLTLTNDNIYRVNTAGTLIGDGDGNDHNFANSVHSTLSIEPGTLFIGSTQNAIVITRGSKISALGTKANPIVMDSESAVDAWIGGNDNGGARRDWGGLVLTGTGVVNNCPDATYCDQVVEGLSYNVLYGGHDTASDCGTVQYVVLSHTGSFDINGNDLNALTTYACDPPTKVSYVEADYAGDDSFEQFGGTTFFDHLVTYGGIDDNFDCDYGFRGGVQFMLVAQAADDGDKGFEWDNGCTSGLCTDPNAHLNLPRSMPTAVNVTLMMQPTVATSSSTGMGFRSHTAANVWNVLETNAKDSGVRSEGYAGNGSAYAALNRATVGETGESITLNNVWEYNPNCATNEGQATGNKLRSFDAVNDQPALHSIFFANPNNQLNMDPMLNTNPLVKALGYPQQ